jgi:hypothetical protein
MTQPAPAQPPERPAVRASDTDRERVAAVVREAVGDGRLTLVEGDERLAGVYAAIHRHELAAYTRDLGTDTPAEGPERAPGTPPAPVGERPTTTSSVAVMGGTVRKGAWTPGHTHTAVAVMGGAELDLRRARLGGQGLTIVALALMGGVEIDLRGADIGAGGVTIRAFALMGGVNVLVDRGTRVEENGIGLAGGFTDSSGPPTRTDGPVVHLTGLALMGGVDVTRRPPTVDAQGRRELDRDGRDGQLPAG